MGIDALAGIVRINPQKAQDYQLAVMDCLEDRDETLKLKTLGLLVKMTKPNNVEVCQLALWVELLDGPKAKPTVGYVYSIPQSSQHIAACKLVATLW